MIRYMMKYMPILRKKYQDMVELCPYSFLSLRNQAMVTYLWNSTHLKKLKRQEEYNILI